MHNVKQMWTVNSGTAILLWWVWRSFLRSLVGLVELFLRVDGSAALIRASRLEPSSRRRLRI